jgi:hypothetical protein
MRNWLRSSRTRLRSRSMKASKRTVNLAMRSRKSSKPKFIDGRDSAIDGFESGRSYVRVAILFLRDRRFLDVEIGLRGPMLR